MVSVDPTSPKIAVTTTPTDDASALAELRKRIRSLEQEKIRLLALNEELADFNRFAVGRELRMIELKEEINTLCVATGQAPRYRLDFGEGPP